MKKSTSHGKVSLQIGVAGTAITMMVMQNLFGSLAANYLRDLAVCFGVGLLVGFAWFLLMRPKEDDPRK